MLIEKTKIFLLIFSPFNIIYFFHARLSKREINLSAFFSLENFPYHQAASAYLPSHLPPPALLYPFSRKKLP
jgi:hypothetical protein